MKISNLYGKEITSIDGKRKGIILGIINDNDAIEWLICCDESEKRFTVNAESVTSLCGQTRFTKVAKAQKKSASLRLGRAVYDCKGMFCGYMEDCLINGLKITHAVVNGRKIPFNDVIIGDICIIKDGKTGAALAAKDLFIDAVCGAQEADAQEN